MVEIVLGLSKWICAKGGRSFLRYMRTCSSCSATGEEYLMRRRWKCSALDSNRCAPTSRRNWSSSTPSQLAGTRSDLGGGETPTSLQKSRSRRKRPGRRHRLLALSGTSVAANELVRRNGAGRALPLAGRWHHPGRKFPASTAAYIRKSSRRSRRSQTDRCCSRSSST
jgi:hypothetical protein